MTVVLRACKRRLQIEINYNNKYSQIKDKYLIKIKMEKRNRTSKLN